jgi:hypothetical protein
MRMTAHPARFRPERHQREIHFQTIPRNLNDFAVRADEANLASKQNKERTVDLEALARCCPFRETLVVAESVGK